MKNLANYTIEEFKEMFKEIPYDKVEIVYDYYHRNKRYIIDTFAMKKNISVATLYRYVRLINSKYERH